MIDFLKMEKDAKKEAFRKYLENSGVLDALTKVLVSLYEQDDKPSSAIEFIQHKLGGPTASDHEKLKGELYDLQAKYDKLLATNQELCKELKGISAVVQPEACQDTTTRDSPSETLRGSL